MVLRRLTRVGGGRRDAEQHVLAVPSFAGFAAFRDGLARGRGLGLRLG